MEASLREALSPAGLDAEIVDYLVSLAKEYCEDGTIDSKQALEEQLAPFLEQYGAADSSDKVAALLANVTLDDKPRAGKQKSQPQKQQNGSNVGNNKQHQPLTTDQAVVPKEVLFEGDDWGTKDLPVQFVTNTVVDRIETAAEKRRRERKEEKEKRIQEMAIEKELQEIEAERARGVANQVTASARIDDGSGKRSSGDINLENVTLTVGTLGGARDLLVNTTLRLSRGQKYGLIARNGYGKSTLLTKIARRELEKFPTNISILYVAQEVAGSESTAVESVMRGDAELIKLKEEEKQAAEANDATRMAQVATKLEAIDAAGAEARARSLLSSLGFSNAMQNMPTKALSGGWRMRAALASALFGAPDLLLLDEPTNGLSLDAVIWLEDYLINRLEPHTTLVVVSHDRVFLNNVVNNVIQIEQQQLHYYKGDIDTFEKTKMQQRIQQQRERDAQLGKIAHMQKFVDRFRYNAKRASLAQSRLKAIARLEAVLCDEVYQEPEMRLEFPDPFDETTGPHIVVEDVSFSYTKDTPVLFQNVDFNLSPGSKVVLLGLNGLGKSTFMKIVGGQLDPTSGLVRRRSTCRVSFFAQHSIEQLDAKMTPLDFMLSKFPGVSPLEMRPHLARFGVTAELCAQRIGTLSGGQKSRVAFALVTWTRPHVLLLDEPSSHLDMETADALNAACAMWNGALLIISHDQNLISTVPDELWVLEKKRIKRLDVEFNDYKKRLLKEGCGAA